MGLPLYKDDNQTMQLMQTKWKAQLDPLLGLPLNNGALLKGVSLNNGVTVINHKLGRMMQGWIVADVNGLASIYRSQPLNDKTLTLTSNAAVQISLWVF